jgi:peptidoglycan/LPS O-acetylase OafA/YrhL
MISKYRKDIDGLRAIAVLAVVLDHFKFTLFSGGFTGVDIFFVISGFLITKSIHNDLQNDSFSFKQFYIRRIRRLFPAFAFTVILTFITSLLLLTPEAVVEFCKSAQSAIFAFSNFYFWNQVGYFDASAETKPLLHTWSLSVEEQFYLIWPSVLIILGFNKKSSPIFKKLLILFLIGFFTAEAILIRESSAAYFLMPARMFEFVIGALAGYLTLNKNQSELLSLFALISIFVCSIVYNQFTRFPGASALIPCIATAILLISEKSFINRKVLSNSVLSYVGRISYSFYLLHWPVYVFLKIYFGHLNLATQLAGIGLSFILSVTSFKYVETPFRQLDFKWWKNYSYRTIITWALFSLLIFSPITYAGIYNNEDSRLSREALEYTKKRKLQLKEFKTRGLNDVCWLWQEQESYEDSLNKFKINHCFEPKDGEKNVLVFGDSHSAHLFGALKETFHEYNFYMLTGGDCDFSELYIRTRKTCAVIYDLMKKIDLNKFDYLVTGIRIWYDFRSKDILDRIKDAVKDYKGTLIYFGPVPYYGSTVMDTIYLQQFNPLFNRATNSLKDTYSKLVDPNSFHMEKVISSQLKGHSNIKYVSILKQICNGSPSTCKHFTKKGDPILIDETHLSPDASLELIQSMKTNGVLAL